MNTFVKISLFLLRISLGWVFLYGGITKVLNPSWSAAGYIGAAKNLQPFYEFMLSPSILPIVNIMNAWGLTLIGIMLILGLWTRLAAIMGAMMMALYYIPILDFPYPNPNSFIVDQHIIYILVLSSLAALRVGRIWGLDEKFSRKFPSIAKITG